MNDQQLIEALRRLDRPVSVEAAFGDALFARLQGEIRRRRGPRVLLLVAAALLAAALIGTAFITGALREQEQPLPVPDYVVEAPLDGEPESSAAEVVEAVRAFRVGFYGDPQPPTSIARVSWVPAGVEYALPDGSAMADTRRPFWVVEVVASGPGHRYLLMLRDGTLELFGSQDLPAATPTPLLTPPPRIADPTAPLILTAADGRTITAAVVPIPEPDKLPAVGPLRAIGGELWGSVTFPMREGELGYDFRVDSASNELIREQPPVEPSPDPAFVPSRIGVVIAEDDFGHWARVPGGIELRDAATGALIRTIETREGEGHAYRGIDGPPAFGSLWDLDRGTGTVYRIDPATGEDVATIQIDVATDLEACGDPAPVVGVSGLRPVVVSQCDGIAVLIDPAKNEVTGTLVASIYNSILIDGTWWWLDYTDDPWDAPGRLQAVDPAGGPPLGRLDLGIRATGGWAPVVAGDSLWFVIGERSGAEYWFDNHQRLVRLPLDDLRTFVEGGAT